MRIEGETEKAPYPVKDRALIYLTVAVIVAMSPQLRGDFSRMRNYIMLAALLALGGCQSVEMASTPRSITFNGVGVQSIKDATAQAQAHCAKNGRDAELIPDGVADGIATFKCVDR